MSGGACGMPNDWRKLNRLLTLQIGDTAKDQMAFLGVQCALRECDDMIVALKLITYLVKRKQFRCGVQLDRQQVGGKRTQLSFRWTNVRALVTMDEPGALY